MDNILAKDFEYFAESRIEDILDDLKRDTPASCCFASYAKGFRDAMKILAGA